MSEGYLVHRYFMESQLPHSPQDPSSGDSHVQRPTPWLRVLKQAQGSELLQF